MPDYWITTHWPTPRGEPLFSRHVYVKEHSVTLPQPDDVVFFREAMYATVKGNRVRTVTRHHRGRQTRLELPRGTGGIVGTATVDGPRRPIQSEDVVFDYGDLHEWSVVPCRGFRAGSLALDDLLTMLRKDNPRFLSLWRLPDEELGARLLRAMRR